MLDFIISKKNCTGCGACYSVCPAKCISMHEDEEGFSYPSASDACIKCGMCEKVCPIITPFTTENYTQKAIGFRATNYKIWKNSSSGGAFSSIVEIWGDSQTKVFGAAWNGKKVHHIDVDCSNIQPLRKSKYISSEIEDTYIKAKNYLKEGKKVIFSGCPCQIAGLKSFLRKEYENLLTVDLICHGQGSKKVFNECLKDTEELLKANVMQYEFRAKRKVFETEYLSKVVTDKGDFYLFSERYTQLYLSLICVRPSCGGNCKFHKAERNSDLTIADCKNVECVKPDILGTKFNYSVVIANTQKGEAILNELKNTRTSFDIKLCDVIDNNPNFAVKRKETTDKRDDFFKDFVQNSHKAIVSRTSPTIISTRSLLWQIFDNLPVILRRLIIVSYTRWRN